MSSPAPTAAAPGAAPRLSVIVPAYCEGAHIYANIELLLASLRHSGRSFEVLVVSDGNTDATVAEASRHGGAVRVLDYPVNRGKGYAIRHGISRARGEIVACIDADMELHPDSLEALVGRVEAGADVAVGSKRHPLSEVAYPPFRRFQSGCYQHLVRLLFGLDVTDTQTGIKVFRGDLLSAVAPLCSSDGFAFDLELLVELSARGALIVEGPVHLEYAFNTTTGVGAVLQVLRDTLRIHRRHRARRRPRSIAERVGEAQTDAPRL